MSISILCTRLLQSSPQRWIDSYDLEIDIVPFIQTSTLVNGEIEIALERMKIQDIIAIITSPAAVKALKYWLAYIPINWKFICTEPTTKDMIENWNGFEKNMILHSGTNASQIIPFLGTLSKDYHIVQFIGNKNLSAIPNALNLQKLNWESLQVYENNDTHFDLNRIYKYYLFFSPSAVESFSRGNTIPEESIAIAIGDTTRKKLEEKKIKQIMVSELPTFDSMMERIINYEFKK